jgi:hypothetical protein
MNNQPGTAETDEEPFFLTEEIEAELIAAGNYQPVTKPDKICRFTIHSYYGMKTGETLDEAIARTEAEPGEQS